MPRTDWIRSPCSVKWVDMDEPISGMAFERPSDGTWWIFKGTSLYRLNVDTLELTPVGKLPKALVPAVWIGDNLYGATGGELFRVKLEGK